jgi:hypothetical protein
MTMTSDGPVWWVVLTTDGIGNDQYWVFDSLWEAFGKYRALVVGDAYSVTLCPVALSTDYESHPVFRDVMSLVTTVMGGMP